MRISDWSSDVCSSDLSGARSLQRRAADEAGRSGRRQPSGRRPRAGPEQCLRLLEEYRCRKSEEHTSELQSLMRISYAVFCLKKKKTKTKIKKKITTKDTQNITSITQQ